MEPLLLGVDEPFNERLVRPKARHGVAQSLIQALLKSTNLSKAWSDLS
jgi:hypothetical protein